MGCGVSLTITSHELLEEHDAASYGQSSKSGSVCEEGKILFWR